MARVREYRYDDTPIGNGGVAADGTALLGLNYGRLARLRFVTGYPGAVDWSEDDRRRTATAFSSLTSKVGKSDSWSPIASLLNC